MTEGVYMLRAGRCCCTIAICLLPWVGALEAQVSAQHSQQMDQQRVVQAEARKALEESERRIAALQAEQIKEAQARSEQQRRALAEADRRREAEQHYEEFLQTQARAQQSKPPQPQDEQEAPKISPEPAVAIVPTRAVEPQRRQHLFVRQAGFVLMIGSSFAAFFILFSIVREWLTH